MWRRALGTGSFIVGLISLAAFLIIFAGRPPASASTKQLAEFGLRALVLFSLTCISFLSAALFSWLSLLQTRRLYREERLNSFGDLIEGTLRDHAKDHSDEE